MFIMTIVRFLLMLSAVVAVPTVQKLYLCNDETGFCERQPHGSLEGSPQDLCLLTCKGTIWPAPLDVKITHETEAFCKVSFTGFPRNEIESAAADNFLSSLHLVGTCPYPEKTLEVFFEANPAPSGEYYRMSIQTDESYSLIVRSTETGAKAVISASSFFGSRHALETLSQLVARGAVAHNGSTANVVASDVRIFDKPAYPYRGVLLDLSRNYLSISTIEAVIRGMGYNKLNRLHLHLSDTASFPLFMESLPEMAAYGAYGDNMQYDSATLQQLTRYAIAHGVAIVPEIDTPSHVNEGWQWGKMEGKGDFSICTTNWTITALEPPGGHLNIANENFPDLFHIGGDEVIVGSDDTYAACWNSSTFGTDILNMLTDLGLSRDDKESFYSLWHTFTHRVAAMVTSFYDHSQRKGKMIIWGGNAEPDESVTYNMVARPDVVEELPPADYIMEIWDESSHSIAPTLLEKGYEIILANYDYVYLDCGQPGFTNPGGYWCNPYHEWFHIYQYMADMQQKWNLPQPMDSKGTGSEGRIIGSEILLWGEENGDQTVEKKVWPRGAALAEALWSNPQAGWYAADPRMQLWRNKMVARGVSAEELQPLWCAQNGPYSCTVDMGVPQS